MMRMPERLPTRVYVPICHPSRLQKTSFALYLEVIFRVFSFPSRALYRGYLHFSSVYALVGVKQGIPGGVYVQEVVGSSRAM